MNGAVVYSLDVGSDTQVLHLSFLKVTASRKSPSISFFIDTQCDVSPKFFCAIPSTIAVSFSFLSVHYHQQNTFLHMLIIATSNTSEKHLKRAIEDS